MSLNEFSLCGWYHRMPDEKFDSKGRRAVICKLCFGPLETDFYGIEKDKFYHEYHYIEGVLEDEIEFSYISKDAFLNELGKEIELSIKYNADELTKALTEIQKSLIDN